MVGLGPDPKITIAAELGSDPKITIEITV